MKYIDEYRDKEIVGKISNKIRDISKKKIALMEVCGGHTMAIHKSGIPSLLPENIKLLSGPGCPVCVTSKSFIDKAIAYSRLSDVIITTGISDVDTAIAIIIFYNVIFAIVVEMKPIIV